MRRYITGPAIGPVGRGHVHEFALGHDLNPYIPANGPESGPPGPLARGYHPTAMPLYEPRGAALGDVGVLLKSPLFLGALALTAFVLWQSGKKKPKRRNSARSRAAARAAIARRPERYAQRKYVVSWPEGGRTRRRQFGGMAGAKSARTFARNRPGSRLFMRFRDDRSWKRVPK